MNIRTPYLPDPWSPDGQALPMPEDIDCDRLLLQVADLLVEAGVLSAGTTMRTRLTAAIQRVLREGFESVIDGLVLTVDAAAESERAVMEARNEQR